MSIFGGEPVAAAANDSGAGEPKQHVAEAPDSRVEPAPLAPESAGDFPPASESERWVTLDEPLPAESGTEAAPPEQVEQAEVVQTVEPAESVVTAEPLEQAEPVEMPDQAPAPEPSDRAETAGSVEEAESVVTAEPLEQAEPEAAVAAEPASDEGAGAAAPPASLAVSAAPAEPESFSVLLRDMLADLSSSHDELIPEIQPVVDERDRTLAAVEAQESLSGLETILFDDDRQFPQHIVWLRHVSGDVTRLRRAELESEDALASLTRLRETHLRSPSGGTEAGPADGAAGAENARYGTLKLAAVATQRGPAPLERLLRRYRSAQRWRAALRWLGRVVWAGIVGALAFAWYQGLFPYGHYAAGAALVLWLVQELVLNPRLDRRHVERTRATAHAAIEDFFASRLIALLEMALVGAQLGRMDAR